jgi:hypothetical protein
MVNTRNRNTNAENNATNINAENNNAANPRLTLEQVLMMQTQMLQTMQNAQHQAPSLLPRDRLGGFQCTKHLLSLTLWNPWMLMTGSRL